jgi:hypothetical protein
VLAWDRETPVYVGSDRKGFLGQEAREEGRACTKALGRERGIWRDGGVSWLQTKPRPGQARILLFILKNSKKPFQHFK